MRYALGVEYDGSGFQGWQGLGPSGPKTVTEAAAYGTTRELLAAMRERIAAAVQDPNCPPRDLAALTRRLHEIVRDIEAIDARADDEATRTAVTDAPFDAAAI